MDESKNLNIKELIELIAVPEIADQFFYSISGIKSNAFQVKINDYRKKRDLTRQLTFESKLKGTKEDYGLCWFELFRFDVNDWRISHIEPTPLPYYKISEVLPEDVVVEIDSVVPDKDKAYSFDSFYSRTENRMFDLQFFRYSSNNAFGTIKETVQSVEQRHRTHQFTANEKMDTSLRVFFHYMQKSPAIREYFFGELFGRLKPFVDQVDKVDQEELLKRVILK